MSKQKDGTPMVKQIMKVLELMLLRLNADWNNWFMNEPVLLEKGFPA